MSDWWTVGRIRGRAWQDKMGYWLRVLGVDTRDQDIFARLYLLYIVLIGAGWVVLAVSGAATMAHAIGRPLPPALQSLLPDAASGLALVVVAWNLVRLPFLLEHGDLQWLVTAPISARPLTVYEFIPRQVRVFLIAAVAGTLLAALTHRPNIVAAGLALGLFTAAFAAVGYAGNLWRTSRRGRPWGGVWIYVVLAVGAVWLAAPLVITAPARWALVPFWVGRGAVSLAPGLVLLVIGWAAVTTLAGGLNLLTIQEGSDLYADIRALGTQYLPNPALVQELRQQAKLSRRRAAGRLPPWRGGWWELGRIVVSVRRMPVQLWRLVELALLMRAGVLLVYGPHLGLAWLLWVLLAYRFRLGSMALWFRRDVGDPFLRQFWMESGPQRYLTSTWMPFGFVFLLALAVTFLLPLGVKASLAHLVFLLGLLVAWHLAEGVTALRSLSGGGRTLQGHDGSVIAAGVMLLVAVQFHAPTLALVVPAILMGVYASSLGRAQADETDAASTPV